MKNIKNVGLVILICFGFISADANIDPTRSSSPKLNPDVKPTINYREDCLQSEEQTFQNINNVRARLTTGGDVWWNLQVGQYYVPQPPDGDLTRGVSSIFAGSVWIGGFDSGGNLKLAANTYRDLNSNDFYTGPLNPDDGLTDLPICQDWDEFFKVLGDNVRNAATLYDANGGSIPCDSIKDGVRYWPGKGNPFWLDKYPFDLPTTGQGLGSFWDEDQDGIYNPCMGDFPTIDIRGCEPDNRKEAIELVPDEMFFWIYNDAGGPHTSTQGSPIQMEIQVQSFAYATNDEINDMTFQRYKLINRAKDNIRDCYFAMWVDPDLGCAFDDFIGCDVERSMAYVYNEDILDGETGCNCGETNTYCDQVPILGVDYFRGPLAPVKIDNINGREHVVANADDFDDNVFSIGDTIYVVNVLPEELDAADLSVELGMSSFTYSNNGGIGNPAPGTTDPAIAQEYYNYLTGNWRDGTPVTFGGSGYNQGSTDEIDFAFPGLPNDGSAWSMCTANEPFGDRRTVQASGPFLLEPGAVNELIIGAVWVPDIAYPCPDISRLQAADDLAQALFDNCFDITDGPDAPDVCAIELDQEVVLVLSNDEITSNNAFLEYQEKDLLAPMGESDSLYVFEGYKIFQLINAEVSAQELDNIEKARLVRQVDLQNGVSTLFNWTSEASPVNGEPIWSFEKMVEGADEGIRNTFRITTDNFASGSDTRLINHTEYFFLVVAYAYNNYGDFDTANPETTQRKPYLEGRGNIQTYTVVPRPIVYTKLNSEYGNGPIITRLAGEGVGYNDVELADGMHDAILDGTYDGRLTYKANAGPLSIDIYNPFEVKDAVFTLELVGEQNTGPGENCVLKEGARWQLTDNDTGNVIASDTSIDELNEQLVADYGFSVSINQKPDAGEAEDASGALAATVNYADISKPSWFLGVSDGGTTLGVSEDNNGFALPTLDFLKTNDGEEDGDLDPGAGYSNLGDSYFVPFYLTDFRAPGLGTAPYITPGFTDFNGGFFLRGSMGLYDLNNVDIVMTSDKDKWSRCVVVETANSSQRTGTPGAIYETIGGSTQFDLRASESVNREGNPDGTGEGMGWFPGYAIDVETGKRLNIFFGENSTYGEDYIDRFDINAPIGADMLFNPSDQELIEDIPGTPQSLWNLMLGGGHMIYVTRQEYDGCERMATDLKGPCPSICFQKTKALQLVTWTSVAMAAPGTQMLSVADGLIPNDVTIRLRTTNTYSEERNIVYGATSCDTEGELPKYEIDFSGFQKEDLEIEEYEGALANVAAVPNPYYAYSEYETSQFTNTIKITNLPARADVSIYSIDGKFIKQFKRDENPGRKAGANPGVINNQVYPDLEWNLENYAGIPVASGVYLFHISAPELGEERTIKWFGVHRKFDPTGL